MSHYPQAPPPPRPQSMLARLSKVRFSRPASIVYEGEGGGGGGEKKSTN